MSRGGSRELVLGGVLLLLVWIAFLRPVSFEWAGGGRDDGPEPDDLPWNTIVRDPVHWEHNGTSAVLGACSHGSCPLSLRTDDHPEAPWGVLYWRLPWTSDDSVAADIPRQARAEHGESKEDGPAILPHRVSTATYHARDPAFDLGLVTVGAVLLRLGIGGDRARSAAVAWAATVPFAPFVAPLGYTIFTPLFPVVVLGLAGLAIRWTWQRPGVRRATDTLFEAAAVLGLLGLAMVPYFTAAPLA